MIASGDLQERITIQTATVTRDAFGAEAITWQDSATVWAKVTPRTGREPILADRPVMLVGYEIRIRSGATVTHKNRLVWRSKPLNIDAISHFPTAGYTILACTEVDS